MQLIIKNHGENLTTFCKYLIGLMIDWIDNNINVRKLIHIDNYLNSQVNWNWKYKPKKVLSKNIIKSAIYNLEILNNENNTILKLNSNAMIPESNISYLQIINLITYGNLSLVGYPICNTMLEYFSNNLSDIYMDYCEGK